MTVNAPQSILRIPCSRTRSPRATAIGSQSQPHFSAILAVTHLLLDNDVATVTENRQTFVSIGQALGAVQDKRLITFLLDQDEATTRMGSSTAALRVIHDMFDLEMILWTSVGGVVGPRNSHDSQLITYLCNKSAEDNLSPPAMPALVAAAMGTHKRTIKTDRAPKWGTGQILLFNAFSTLGTYFTSTDDRVVSSRFVCELFRDVAWMGVEEVHRVPKCGVNTKTRPLGLDVPLRLLSTPLRALGGPGDPQSPA